MKVIITKTFEKFLSKYFSNYYIKLQDLSNELIKSFKNEIYLKRPIIKFKIRLNKLSYRVVWIIKEDKIVPILIFLKKDKNFWENLIWNKELEILINHYSIKMWIDFKKWNLKYFSKK